MRTGDRLNGGAGVLVVDIDLGSGGFETWDFLRDDHPEPIETVTVSTGGGGRHFWFEHSSGTDIRSGAAVLGAGVDIRANGGYVLVPPSRTQDDYVFELHPDDAPIEQCPAWILAWLEVSPTVKQLPAGTRIGPEVQQGVRHKALLSFAGAMRRVGMTTKKSNQLCRPSVTNGLRQGITPWPTRRSRLLSVDREKHLSSPDRPGQCERFLNLYGTDVRYCYEWDKWLVWDGRRWAVDDVPTLMSYAHTLYAAFIKRQRRLG